MTLMLFHVEVVEEMDIEHLLIHVGSAGIHSLIVNVSIVDKPLVQELVHLHLLVPAQIVAGSGWINSSANCTTCRCKW